MIALRRVAFSRSASEQAHGLDGQLRRLDDVIAHPGHLGFERGDLEQQHGLGRLLHLVDRVVERVDEILDVAPVEGRDEGAPDEKQHFARDGVGLALERHHLLRRGGDAGSPFQELLKRLGPLDEDVGMARKQLKKPVFARHECLKPAKHEGHPVRERGVNYL